MRHNKVKLLVLALLMVSAVTFASGQVALAAPGPGGLNYSVGIQVQNLDSVNVASIQITYYVQSTGAALPTSLTDTISAGGSKTYYPILTGVPNGPTATSFDGSVVVTSDRQVAAITNVVANSNAYSEAYTSFSAGSTTFNLPLIMCNNGGYNTFFNVQNAGGGSVANVTITYTAGSIGNSGLTETATINAGAAKTFNQAPGSLTRNCSTLGAGPSLKFVGSAKITSDQPVVATVVELNTTSLPGMYVYNGFAAGSTTVKLPLIMANNNGWYTGVQIQNTGASSTNVTMTYSAPSGGGSTPPVESFSLAAGAAKTIIHNGAPPANGSATNWSTWGKYVGGATVTSSGQPLVAIVNEVAGTSGFGAYEGFNPSAATANGSAPLIMANNSGYYTGIQIQNAGAASCGSVSVIYSANTGGGPNPTNEPAFSLAAGSSKTILQNGPSPANGSVNNWSTFGKYVGSVRISAPGCQIVAIVNEFAAGTGDKLSVYDAFNY